MPAPPPYGSSSTCPARRGVVSRYEKRRRLSSVPSTPARGRCSVSQAKACGTRVKTSSCTERRIRLAAETRSDDDPAVLEVNLQHAVLDHRQGERSVELEYVIGHSRRDIRHGAEDAPALLLDPQPDKLEDVELV